jgi:hypothetical protein
MLRDGLRALVIRIIEQFAEVCFLLVVPAMWPWKPLRMTRTLAKLVRRINTNGRSVYPGSAPTRGSEAVVAAVATAGVMDGKIEAPWSAVPTTLRKGAKSSRPTP